jgi:hypothetical protein
MILGQCGGASDRSSLHSQSLLYSFDGDDVDDALLCV